MTIFEAAKSGNLEVVKQFVDKGKNPNVLDGHNAWTPLMFASFRGHLDVARFLLERGANYNLQNSLGGTALMIASHHGWLGIVKLLFKHKADSNVKTRDDHTALHYATLSTNPSILFLFHKHSRLLNEDEKKTLQEKRYRCRFAKEICL